MNSLNQEGYIYIATNQDNQENDIFKIGKTMNLKNRLSSYNSGRTFKESYFYVYYMYSSNLNDNEINIHKSLDYFRYQDNKEIYNCDLFILINCIKGIIESISSENKLFLENLIKPKEVIKEEDKENDNININYVSLFNSLLKLFYKINYKKIYDQSIIDPLLFAIKNNKIPYKLNNIIELKDIYCFVCCRKHKNPFTLTFFKDYIRIGKKGNPRSCAILPIHYSYDFFKL